MKQINGGGGTSLRERAELALEPGHQRVELLDDGAHRLWAAQVDARALQQWNRMIAAACSKERQIALDGGCALAFRPARDLLHQLRARREAGGVLIDVIGRAVEMWNARPGHARQLVVGE